MCLTLLLATLPLLSLAQDKAAAPAVKPSELKLPKEAADILALASRTNGLGSLALQPWHLTAKYDAFTRKGKPDGSGTFEVYWAGPKKYKQIITSADFTQTEYVTDKGIFRTGNPNGVPYPQAFLSEQLMHPMPAQDEVDEASPERRDQDFGKVKLACVMLSQKNTRIVDAPLGVFPTYCFDTNMPLLRAATFSGGIDVFFDNPAIFQGKFFARQIVVKDMKTVRINIQIDNLTGMAALDETIFVPPPDAVAPNLYSGRPISPSIMAGLLIKKVEAIYPQALAPYRVEGDVVLQATIGSDGRIHRLKVLKSPDPQLSLASLIAVQQWVYKPYLVAGEPVQLTTQMTVTFGSHH